MNPYEQIDDNQFWGRQVGGSHIADIEYDPSPKFVFELNKDVFATAGSCFAQHFARELVSNGGNYNMAERPHPLERTADHGFGVFSARYGNIYTTRQLMELLQQSFDEKDAIFDIVKRDDNRWIDMLRPMAVPQGFSSIVEAQIDRRWHLEKVRDMFAQSTVFVFTLGLTELWENSQFGYAYPLCPGTAAGTFDPDRHKFVNQNYLSVLECLRESVILIQRHHPHIKILLTVSPVMLVATFENKGAIQASIVSKAILRAAADACVQEFDHVDYFPSYEIVSGPQAKGLFYRPGERDVSSNGVQCVMKSFFKSRFNMQLPREEGTMKGDPKEAADPIEKEVDDAFQVECDEILLDPKSNKHNG